MYGKTYTTQLTYSSVTTCLHSGHVRCSLSHGSTQFWWKGCPQPGRARTVSPVSKSSKQIEHLPGRGSSSTLVASPSSSELLSPLARSAACCWSTIRASTSNNVSTGSGSADGKKSFGVQH